ncbi:uncharacterized protein [Polyergus mexicanus]|uniref:uncharacterized protein n=1 Tax=Polyergus mexicanus TaxID=615972 RepID=UPI0038B6A51B
MFTYNTTPHTATGYTPFELVYGHQADLPTSLTRQPKPTYNYDDYAQELKERLRATSQLAKEHIKEKKIKAKKQYDKGYSSAGTADRPRVARGNMTSPYQIQEFLHNPGIYFEKIGQLQQATKTWKLVIKLDITTLNDKAWQINQYIQQTNEMCEQIKSEFHHKRTCDNLEKIVKNESKQLTKLMTLINTLYKTRTNGRRGLVDGIGTIAKTLFGTMDANDRELINEQLNLLQNNQQTIQHIAENQIKILNSTIIHLDKLENILDHNGKLLNHYVREYSTREEITEHFTVIIAMITDLIRDAEDVIEYLTYVRKGTMHPVLTPISDIMTQLKEAAIQLPHEMTIQPKEVIQGSEIETYLPEINITFIRDNTDILDTKQQNIVQHSELTELKNKLTEMNNNLQDNNDKFFTQKQFMNMPTKKRTNTKGSDTLDRQRSGIVPATPRSSSDDGLPAVLPTGTAGERTTAEVDVGSAMEVEVEDIPQEGIPPSPETKAAKPPSGERRRKKKSPVVVLDRLPRYLDDPEVGGSTVEEYLECTKGIPLMEGDCGRELEEFFINCYTRKGKWIPPEKHQLDTGGASGCSREGAPSRTVRRQEAEARRTTRRTTEVERLRARTPSSSSLDLGAGTRSRSVSPVRSEDLELAALAKRKRGRPPTTGEYVGRAEAIERLAAAKERELRVLEEERSLQAGFVPPETQGTRSLPSEHEVAEQARDLTAAEIERRARESLGELERMVSVSSNLKGTSKRGMHLTAVRVKAYCAELLNRTGTGEDSQVGLLRSANEWLRRRLTTCESEIAALREEVAILRGGQRTKKRIDVAESFVFKIETRNDVLSKRIDAVKNSVSRTEASTNALGKWIDALDKRINSLSERLDAAKKTISLNAAESLTRRESDRKIQFNQSKIIQELTKKSRVAENAVTNSAAKILELENSTSQLKRNTDQLSEKATELTNRKKREL